MSARLGPPETNSAPSSPRLCQLSRDAGLPDRRADCGGAIHCGALWFWSCDIRVATCMIARMTTWLMTPSTTTATTTEAMTRARTSRMTRLLSRSTQSNRRSITHHRPSRARKTTTATTALPRTKPRPGPGSPTDCAVRFCHPTLANGNPTTPTASTATHSRISARRAPGRMDTRRSAHRANPPKTHASVMPTP